MIRRMFRRLWPAPFRPTWDGIYSHPRDVPSDGKSYGDEQIANGIAEFAQRALAKQRRGEDPALWHSALAVLSGAIAGKRGTVEILDFGGGVGTACIQLLAALPSPAKFRIQVIDQTEMCVAGRQLFAGDPRISFDTTLDASRGTPDIVYANSVLPYIEDYAGLLRRIAQIGAPWILIGRLAGGNYATYSTRQLNVPGRVMPYWFHNFEEITGILKGCGYSVVYKGLTGPEYDQRNFPSAYRVGRMCDVLFCKTKQYPA